MNINQNTNLSANSTQNETNYEIRFNKNYTIATVSKEFKEQMFVYGSPAFKIANDIRSFFPHITFRVATDYVQKTKKKTYKMMVEHLEAKIALLQDSEDDAEVKEKERLEKALSQFEAMKKLSKIQHSPYAFMVKWFKGYCPELFEKKTKEDEASAEDDDDDEIDE